MIQVYRIPVPKDRLRAMPKEERVFLLLLGYAANQLSMLQKLLMFSSNKVPPNELEQHLSGAQTQMLVRYIIGVLHETWLLIERHYLAGQLGRDYQERLDPEGREALARLRKLIGGSNLLSKVRNNFAFHNPKSIDVEAAFGAACNDSDLDDHWMLYFSHHGFNSFYFLSDLIIVHGIREHIGESDLIAAQQKLMVEMVSAVDSIFEFSKAFTAAAWLKNFGAEMMAKDAVAIHGAPDVCEVWIPFFVEMNPSSLSNL